MRSFSLSLVCFPIGRYGRAACTACIGSNALPTPFFWEDYCSWFSFVALSPMRSGNVPTSRSAQAPWRLRFLPRILSFTPLFFFLFLSEGRTEEVLHFHRFGAV